MSGGTGISAQFSADIEEFLAPLLADSVGIEATQLAKGLGDGRTTDSQIIVANGPCKSPSGAACRKRRIGNEQFECRIFRVDNPA